MIVGSCKSASGIISLFPNCDKGTLVSLEENNQL